MATVLELLRPLEIQAAMLGRSSDAVMKQAIESVGSVFAQHKLGSKEGCNREHLVGIVGPGTCVSRIHDALGGNKASIGKPSRQTSNGSA